MGFAWRMNPLESVGPKLAGLLALPGVTDLFINGFSQAYVQRSGFALEQVVSPFESESELASLAQSLIAKGGRHVDQANPFADVAIGGLRVHTALASGCNASTHLSIRVHLNRHYGLEQLTGFGMLDSLQVSLLREILGNRQSFLISGATGSGKTTLLRAMLSECVGERIIALEDVAELNLQMANFVSLQTRQSNIEGRGEINLEKLVREALRMRPDRLVVGEVRGGELLVMLQALNTGHQGAGATIHANSASHVISRVNAIGQSFGMNEKSIHQQMKSAFSWLIHVESHKVVSIERFD